MMKESKKSQQAVEFIATYGWMIIAGVVVVSALAYFGVLDFSKFAPRNCVLEPGVTCQDFYIGQYDSGNGILRLKVKNNLGYDISITSWNTSSETDVSFSCADLPEPTPISHGDSAVFDLDDCNNNESGLLAGKKAKVSINIGYVNLDSQLPKSTEGTVLEVVEPIGAAGLFNQTQCSDNIDNDANLCADFAGGDTGCSSSNDVSESGGSCPSAGGAGMALYCYVSTICDETTIFRLSYLSNAHAEISTFSNYNYNVCCRSENDTITNSCASPDYIPIHLSNISNSHAEKNTQTDYNTDVCISAQIGDVSCTYNTTSCSANDACLATISSDTNAHLADCITEPYGTRICCTLN